jgi:PAS domain S-box-containing protein
MVSTEAKKILVIEDDPAFANALAMTLNLDLPAEFTFAENCLAARRAFLSADFDLITLDYQVPGGDGLLLLAEIVATENSPPVIMVTGHGDEKVAAQAFNLGAAGYVVKDNRASTLLLQTVKAALEKEEYRKAIEESERKFRFLAENISDNVWTLDLDLNRTYTSPSFERILGYTTEEAMYIPITRTLTPGSLELIGRVLGEELEKEQAGADPERVRMLQLEEVHKDGSTVFTESSLSFIRDENGSPVGILGVTRDITERVRAEEAIRAQDERFRVIVANFPDLVWMTDLDLSFTYVSPSVSKMGYTVEEALSLSLKDVVTPASLQAASDLLASELATAQEKADEASTIFNLELIRRDGTTFLVEVSAGFLRDVKGVPYGLLGTARDISWRADSLQTAETPPVKRNVDPRD